MSTSVVLPLSVFNLDAKWARDALKARSRYMRRFSTKIIDVFMEIPYRHLFDNAVENTYFISKLIYERSGTSSDRHLRVYYLRKWAALNYCIVSESGKMASQFRLTSLAKYKIGGRFRLAGEIKKSLIICLHFFNMRMVLFAQNVNIILKINYASALIISSYSAVIALMKSASLIYISHLTKQHDEAPI